MPNGEIFVLNDCDDSEEKVDIYKCFILPEEISLKICKNSLIIIPDRTAQGKMENQAIQLIGGDGSILWNSGHERT